MKGGLGDRVGLEARERGSPAPVAENTAMAKATFPITLTKNHIPRFVIITIITKPKSPRPSSPAQTATPRSRRPSATSIEIGTLPNSYRRRRRRRNRSSRLLLLFRSLRLKIQALVSDWV